MRTATELVTAGRGLAEALLDLALPSTCAGCDGTPGPLCHTCADDLEGTLFERPTRSTPDPAPIYLPPLTARGPYAGVLRRLLTAYKDDERRDLRDVLSPLLAESLVVASRMRDVAVVPVPSSRAAVRRRGDDPVGDLVRAAAEQLGGVAQVVPALKTVRRLADQSTLGHRERAANLAGAYAVKARARPILEARAVLLADDVVTTGATLAEAARAVREAGGRVVGAATVAATQRRGPPTSSTASSRDGPRTSAPRRTRSSGTASTTDALRS